MSLGLACDLCGECIETCQGALSITNEKLQYDHEKCTFCEVCMDVCPECAIRVYEDDDE